MSISETMGDSVDSIRYSPRRPCGGDPSCPGEGAEAGAVDDESSDLLPCYPGSSFVTVSVSDAGVKVLQREVDTPPVTYETNKRPPASLLGESKERGVALLLQKRDDDSDRYNLYVNGMKVNDSESEPVKVYIDVLSTLQTDFDGCTAQRRAVSPMCLTLMSSLGACDGVKVTVYASMASDGSVHDVDQAERMFVQRDVLRRTPEFALTRRSMFIAHPMHYKPLPIVVLGKPKYDLGRLAKQASIYTSIWTVAIPVLYNTLGYTSVNAAAQQMFDNIMRTVSSLTQVDVTQVQPLADLIGTGNAAKATDTHLTVGEPTGADNEPQLQGSDDALLFGKLSNFDESANLRYSVLSMDLHHLATDLQKLVSMRKRGASDTQMFQTLEDARERYGPKTLPTHLRLMDFLMEPKLLRCNVHGLNCSGSDVPRLSTVVRLKAGESEFELHHSNKGKGRGYASQWMTRQDEHVDRIFASLRTLSGKGIKEPTTAWILIIWNKVAGPAFIGLLNEFLRYVFDNYGTEVPGLLKGTVVNDIQAMWKWTAVFMTVVQIVRGAWSNRDHFKRVWTNVLSRFEGSREKPSDEDVRRLLEDNEAYLPGNGPDDENDGSGGGGGNDSGNGGGGGERDSGAGVFPFSSRMDRREHGVDLTAGDVPTGTLSDVATGISTVLVPKFIEIVGKFHWVMFIPTLISVLYDENYGLGYRLVDSLLKKAKRVGRTIKSIIDTAAGMSKKYDRSKHLPVGAKKLEEYLTDHGLRQFQRDVEDSVEDEDTGVTSTPVVEARLYQHRIDPSVHTCFLARPIAEALRLETAEINSQRVRTTTDLEACASVAAVCSTTLSEIFNHATQRRVDYTLLKQLCLPTYVLFNATGIGSETGHTMQQFESVLCTPVDIRDLAEMPSESEKDMFRSFAVAGGNAGATAKKLATMSVKGSSMTEAADMVGVGVAAVGAMMVRQLEKELAHVSPASFAKQSMLRSVSSVRAQVRRDSEACVLVLKAAATSLGPLYCDIHGDNVDALFLTSEAAKAAGYALVVAGLTPTSRLLSCHAFKDDVRACISSICASIRDVATRVHTESYVPPFDPLYALVSSLSGEKVVSLGNRRLRSPPYDLNKVVASTRLDIDVVCQKLIGLDLNNARVKDTVINYFVSPSSEDTAYFVVPFGRLRAAASLRDVCPSTFGTTVVFKQDVAAAVRSVSSAEAVNEHTVSPQGAFPLAEDKRMPQSITLSRQEPDGVFTARPVWSQDDTVDSLLWNATRVAACIQILSVQPEHPHAAPDKLHVRVLLVGNLQSPREVHATCVSCLLACALLASTDGATKPAPSLRVVSVRDTIQARGKMEAVVAALEEFMRSREHATLVEVARHLWRTNE